MIPSTEQPTNRRSRRNRRNLIAAAILHGANLDGADLTDAHLSGMYPVISGTPTALPADWVLVDGVLKPAPVQLSLIHI